MKKESFLDRNSGIIFFSLFGITMLIFSMGILISDDSKLPRDYKCGDKNELNFECGNIEKIIGFHWYNYILSFITFVLFLFCFCGLLAIVKNKTRSRR